VVESMEAVTGEVTWTWFIHYNVKSYMHAPLPLGLKGPLPITGGLVVRLMAHIHKLKFFFFFFATSFLDYLIINKTLFIEKESKHYMSLLFQY
jgi:hypothetical protein